VKILSILYTVLPILASGFKCKTKMCIILYSSSRSLYVSQCTYPQVVLFGETFVPVTFQTKITPHIEFDHCLWLYMRNNNYYYTDHHVLVYLP